MKTIVSVFAGISLLCVSCGESSLSDVEISDPSLIRAVASPERYDYNTTTNYDHVIVRLVDKNSHNINLKKGAVYCNNITMKSGSDLLGPYYMLPENDNHVSANTNYMFAIELADGKKYNGEVFVDSSFLASITVPVSSKGTDTLVVSWNAIHSNYTTKLSWSASVDNAASGFSNNSGTADVSGKTVYKFAPAFFKDANGTMVVNNLNITLVSSKTGTIDSHFRSGSACEATFTIIRDVKITK
jgi:hypothetical protein